MGRCGKNFACAYENVTPDIMTVAKAFGGGVMPVGAFISKKEVFAPFEENPFLHTTTFGGNPMACAAVAATIDVLVEERIAEKALKNGELLINKLKELAKEYPKLIKEVRGKGLLIGLEMIDEGASGQLIYELSQQKILVLQMLNNQRVIRIEPPLIIGQEEINILMNALKKSLESIKES